MRGMLTELHLAACWIGDDGAKVVAEFLKHDATVVEVYLGDNNIRWRGIKAIAEALKVNQSVEDLSLSDNLIEEDGADALIDAFRNNVCVKNFYFYGNKKVALKSMAALDYMTQTRNGVRIPATVRRVCLYLIAARLNIADAGHLAVFPKEIVKMIALEVWATRKHSDWIEAVSKPGSGSGSKQTRYHIS